MNRKNTLLALALLLTAAGRAQNVSEENAFNRATRDIEAEAEFATHYNNHDYNPFWLTAGQWGLSDVQGKCNDLTVIVGHDASADKDRNWRIGWGLGVQFDLCKNNLTLSPDNTELTVLVPNAFVDIDYKRVRLSVGSKMRHENELKGELTSGSQTFGRNALPVPAVRFEIPEYLSLGKWLAIKGHFGYGLMTDGGWQEDYLTEPSKYTDCICEIPHYAKHALLHTKAGYLRIGNEKRFPLTFEGGLEMACQFGGTIYNPIGSDKPSIKMPSGLSDFVKAIYGGGSDETDGPYDNAGGNTVGSWLFSLKYHGDGWNIRGYYDHYFEDHSQMFFQYGWLDGLWGIEAELPQNLTRGIVSRICYEYMRTDYQSGPIYHDHTEALPTQISGSDDYYNHILYQGWQHFGMAMGNPFFFSPLYGGSDGSLRFSGSRFRVHHFALSGHATRDISFEAHLSYMTNWGTYSQPYSCERHQTSAGLDIDWNLSRLHIGSYSLSGWSAKAEFGIDGGNVYGDNFGFSLGITKSFHTR